MDSYFWEMSTFQEIHINLEGQPTLTGVSFKERINPTGRLQN